MLAPRLLAPALAVLLAACGPTTASIGPPASAPSQRAREAPDVWIDALTPDTPAAAPDPAPDDGARCRSRIGRGGAVVRGGDRAPPRRVGREGVNPHPSHSREGAEAGGRNRGGRGPAGREERGKRGGGGDRAMSSRAVRGVDSSERVAGPRRLRHEHPNLISSRTPFLRCHRRARKTCDTAGRPDPHGGRVEERPILPPPPPIWMRRSGRPRLRSSAAPPRQSSGRHLDGPPRAEAGRAGGDALGDPRPDRQRGGLPMVAPIGGARSPAHAAIRRPPTHCQLRRDVGHRGERTAKSLPRFRHNEALGALLDQLGAPELSPVDLDALSAGALTAAALGPEASLDLHQAVSSDRPRSCRVRRAWQVLEERGRSPQGPLRPGRRREARSRRTGKEEGFHVEHGNAR